MASEMGGEQEQPHPPWGTREGLFYMEPSAFNFFWLLSNPACHQVELRSGPEERPAHTNATAIGQVDATIVSFWLRENMDSRLSGEQSYV